MHHDEPDWVADHRRAIGRRIHDARRNAGLSQEKLALRCGIDRRTVQRIEAGRTDADLSWLIAIAHEVGVPLAELIGEVPGPVA